MTAPWMLEVEPPRHQRSGGVRYTGGLHGPTWDAEFVLDVAHGGLVQPARGLLGARDVPGLAEGLDGLRHRLARGDVQGFWSDFSAVVNHPASTAVVAALAAIPAVGIVAAPLAVATKTVAAIGASAEAAEIKKHPQKVKAAAQGLAKATNAELQKQNSTVRVTAEDYEAAIKARAVAQAAAKDPKVRIHVTKEAMQAFKAGTPAHRDALAVQMAQLELAGQPLLIDSYPLVQVVEDAPLYAATNLAGWGQDVGCYVVGKSRGCGCGCNGAKGGCGGAS